MRNGEFTTLEGDVRRWVEGGPSKDGC